MTCVIGLCSYYYDGASNSVSSPNDDSCKEYILLFNALPEKLLSNVEAIEIANKILEIDPVNNTALSVINELNNYYLMQLTNALVLQQIAIKIHKLL